MGIAGEVVWGKWVDASVEKPDADIMVLGCYAPSEAWCLVTWDGQDWVEVNTMIDCRVSHWIHLPEGPQ